MNINPPRHAMIMIEFNGQQVEVLPDTQLIIWGGIDYLPREEEFRLWGRDNWEEEIKATYHPFVQDEMIKQKRLHMTM